MNVSIMVVSIIPLIKEFFKNLPPYFLPFLFWKTKFHLQMRYTKWKKEMGILWNKEVTESMDKDMKNLLLLQSLGILRNKEVTESQPQPTYFLTN